MTALYWGFALFLLGNILASLWRTWRGPKASDRMMTVHFFSTMGVGILLILAEATETAALRDVALIFVLLGALALIAFVQARWPEREPDTRSTRSDAGGGGQ